MFSIYLYVFRSLAGYIVFGRFTINPSLVTVMTYFCRCHSRCLVVVLLSIHSFSIFDVDELLLT